MQTHHLSRGARLALTLFLSLAILLPLALLFPRYITWQEQSAQRDAAANYAASVQDTVNQ
jgi:hypothetical protein